MLFCAFQDDPAALPVGKGLLIGPFRANLPAPILTSFLKSVVMIPPLVSNIKFGISGITP